MKRALSLIIVLAMVLCMIPFSAFAAPEWNVGGTDFIDGGNYALLKENNWLIEELLWIPEESGTLKGINFTPYVEEVAEGEVGDDFSDVTVFAEVQGVDVTAEDFEGYSVTAGEGYEISLYTSDVDWKGTATINLVGLEGSQSNPYVIANPEAAAEMGVEAIDTVTVPAGETVFCKLQWFGGETVNVSGEGVKIAMGEDVLGSVDGEDGNPVLVNTVDLEISEGMNAVEIKLSNKTDAEQTYTFAMVEKVIPVGTMDNPEEVPADTYDKAFTVGAEPYYYKYIAEGNGTVKVTLNAVDAQGEAIGWMYQILNNTTYAQNDTRWSTDNPLVNPDTMEVSEGDEIVIWVSTYAPDDAQGNMQPSPAGTVTTTIEFVAEGSEVPEPTVLVLGDNNLTVANGATNEYTFTPDKDGTLTVAVVGLDPAAGNMGMIFGMGNMTLLVNGENFFSPSVECEVTAGTPVTVSLTNNLGQDETVTLNLSMAEPAAEIVLPWSESFDAAHDVYYTYTATEDCIIKFTSTGYLGIDGAEAKMYDENTKYVVLSAGDVISINPWADEAASYTAAIVEELPAANGSSEFPYVIDTVPYDASNSGETTLYYIYTATEDVVLNIIGDCYVDNGGWDDARDEDNNVVLSAGDEIQISIYGGQSFVLDAVDPVATIGDAKYYSIDAAVAAAVNGDTITLAANATAEAGIVLPAGVTLDLGDYSLTAPYVVTLSNAYIIGTVGTATINASDLIANDAIINGVVYEWTGADGVYTLAATTAEAEVAEYEGETYTLSEAIALAAAKASKGNEQTVKLIAAYNNPLAQITIEPYVILDTGACDITAKYIIGLTGSSLQNTVSRFNGAIAEGLKGAINVAKDNIALSSTVVAHNASTAMRITPVWLPEEDCYAVMPLRMNDDGITSNYENDGVALDGFFHQGGNATKANYLFSDNGSTDHGLRFVIRAEWATDTGAYVNDYTYLDSFVKIVASGTGAYTYSINGISEVLKWNPELGSFKLTPMIISDCGAIYYGDTIEITGN